MDPTRDALERALVAEPDDLALHGAYADYLIEQGDPRGEYIRLELAIAQKEEFGVRARAQYLAHAKLMTRHRAEWLGALDRVLPVANPGPFGHPDGRLRLRLGWLDELFMTAPSRELAEAVVACPVGHLLRRLTIETVTRASRRRFVAALALAPALASLREFAWTERGSPRHLTPLAAVLAAMPRLERLALRTPDIRAADLATLPPRLRELRLSGSHVGDAGVEALLAGPALDRLETLILDFCDITDGGAQTLAADPRVRALARLSLAENLLSPIGVEALEAVGIRVSREQRFTRGGDPVGDGDAPF